MTSDSSGDGDLDVGVETGDGQVQEATGYHANGALVMKRCYVQKFTAVLLCNSGSNTWRGSVGYLQDDAYTYLICVLCGGHSKGPIATKFILGCDGRVIRLRSGNSSSVGGGVSEIRPAGPQPGG